MPSGIGYGPLPLPPGLQQQEPTQDALARALLARPEQAPAPLPPPVQIEAQPLPLPLQQEPEPAQPVLPEWLTGLVQRARPAQAQQQVETSPAAAEQPATVDAADPIALALRGAEVAQSAQRAKVQQLELADSALRTAEQRTAQRLEEQRQRQELARQKIDEQNTQIQKSLRDGPGTTWRDVAAAGAGMLGAVLGAAFDRSGTLQKQLPQTLNAIAAQAQERTQAAFARQLQALQVGREGAQDDLDAAMDDERRIEQAGAAARVAITEEALRQIQLAAERGQLDLMTLESQGIPQQMKAELEAAKAKQAAALEEQERKRLEQDLKLAETEAGIRYKEEQIRSERADRAKQWAELDLQRQRLALDKDRSQALKEQDALEVQKKKLDILREQGVITDKEMARAVPLPGGAVLKANSAEQAREFSSQVASAEVLGGLMDQIAVALETGDRDFWGGKEGQELLAKWGAAKLATKDAEQLGAIQGADEALIENLIGKDPTSVSLSNLRTQAPRIREARRILEEKVNARARSISSDFSSNKARIELPRYEAPSKAVPSVEEARGQLLPIQSAVTGKRPRVSDSDFTAAVKTVRETAAASVGGKDRDAIVRTQANELAGALEQTRAEKARLEREHSAAIERRKRMGGTRTEQGRAAWEREKAALEELRTIEKYETNLAKALERERKMLRERVRNLDERAIKAGNVSEEDVKAFKRVERLLGKPAGDK